MRNVEVSKGSSGVGIYVGDYMHDYDNNNGSAQLHLSEAEAALLMEKLRSVLIDQRR